jgi:hypothetical protein
MKKLEQFVDVYEAGRGRPRKNANVDNGDELDVKKVRVPGVGQVDYIEADQLPDDVTKKITAKAKTRLVIPQKLSGIIANHLTVSYLKTCESLFVMIATKSKNATHFKITVCHFSSLTYFFIKIKPIADIKVVTIM